MTTTLTVEQAVVQLRADPDNAARMRDSYLDGDVLAAARRFAASDEFAAVEALLGPVSRRRLLDLGAGTGIASFAFSSRGADVIALEPDGSAEIGQGAVRRLAAVTPIAIAGGVGESIPLGDASVDIVYVRQCLHHAYALPAMLRECARVLLPGGLFLACREHVVDNDAQMQAFLGRHPIHQLAGGEGAFSLDAYRAAITGAGLELQRTIGPWDSVINAFPTARTADDLDRLPALLLSRFGAAGRATASIPGVSPAMRQVLRHLRRPGRMYTFLATKPSR